MITASDAFIAGVLSANNPFTELITYTPNGKSPVEIRATVKRNNGVISRNNIDGRTVYSAEIIISNNATYGIAVVTPRKDTVTMSAPELGKVAHTFQVAGILGKSAMGWHLGLNQ